MARGNAVMRAKRTTGPSPNTELLTRVKCETCDTRGCNNRPLRTDGRGGTIKRVCATCLGAPKAVKVAGIASRGWKPPWMS